MGMLHVFRPPCVCSFFSLFLSFSFCLIRCERRGQVAIVIHCLFVCIQYTMGHYVVAQHASYYLRIDIFVVFSVQWFHILIHFSPLSWTSDSDEQDNASFSAEIFFRRFWFDRSSSRSVNQAQSMWNSHVFFTSVWYDWVWDAPFCCFKIIEEVAIGLPKLFNRIHIIQLALAVCWFSASWWETSDRAETNGGEKNV